MLLQSGLKLYN